MAGHVLHMYKHLLVRIFNNMLLYSIGLQHYWDILFYLKLIVIIIINENGNADLRL